MHKLFMNVKYKKQKFVRVKVIVAIICALLIIAQIIVTNDMINRMNSEYKKITVDQLADVKPNDSVKFTLSRSDTILFYLAKLETGPLMNSVLVRTSDDKLIVVEALDASAPQAFSRLEEMMDTPTLSFEFQGSAAGFVDQINIPLQLNLVAHNTYKEYGLTDEGLTHMYIRLSDPNIIDYYLYAFAGVGVGISLFIAMVALLWKSVNNFIYGIMVQKGYIQPELKVTKDDLMFENEGIYDGKGAYDTDSFYVETEYNVRGEGETELTLQRKQVDRVELDFEGNLIRPVRKERSEDQNIEFYQSGVSEDGNFFINENTVPLSSDTDDDDDENKRLRY